jgi:peptide/nickel transport system permease protein
VSRYIIRRALGTIPLLFGLSLFAFILIHVAPGDPTLYFLPPEGVHVDPEVRFRIAERLGLDKPLHIQYIRWLGRTLQGDLGYAFGYGEPVLSLIAARLPNTLEIQVGALLVSLILAIPIGIVAAIRQYSLLDHFLTVFAFFGLSMPDFWFALMMIFLFAVKLQVLPGIGVAVSSMPFLERIPYLVMPVAALALHDMALYARFMRSSMLEVIRQDYVTTARSKGLKESTVLGRHALKNAILPMITIIGLSLPRLLGGSIIVETIFAWPGIGQLTLDAVLRSDYPTIMGLVLMSGTFILLVNLAVDIAYAFADPRIRFAED